MKQSSETRGNIKIVVTEDDKCSKEEIFHIGKDSYGNIINTLIHETIDYKFPHDCECKKHSHICCNNVEDEVNYNELEDNPNPFQAFEELSEENLNWNVGDEKGIVPKIEVFTIEFEDCYQETVYLTYKDGGGNKIHIPIHTIKKDKMIDPK